MEGFNVDMPLLDGDDFFRNLDVMEQDFLIEGDIQDFDEDDGDAELQSEDEETVVEWVLESILQFWFWLLCRNCHMTIIKKTGSFFTNSRGDAGYYEIHFFL